MTIEMITGDQANVVEKLVGWGAGIKFIENLTKSPVAAKYARLVYKNRGARPPSGQTGAANSLRLRSADVITFTAMANRYIDVRSKGVPAINAIMDVYQAFVDLSDKTTPISVNLWLAFARDVESCIAGVFRCKVCNGAHLWQQSAHREYKHCLWCRDKFKDPWLAESADRQVAVMHKSRSVMNDARTDATLTKGTAKEDRSKHETETCAVLN